MPTREELKILQALPLELKVEKTKARIREWVQYYGVGGVCVSFSGGKDSTVLLHIVRELYPNVEAVFVNTGLEFPEIQRFAKSFDNITILTPKMRFDEVIKQYGYPFISKEISERIYNANKCIENGGLKYVEHFYQIVGEIPIKAQQLLGIKSERYTDRYDFSKYKPLLNVDFKISHLCCKQMKKDPLKKIKKKNIVGTTTEESALRETAWLKTGCNSFQNGVSKPLSFWTEQDILSYIKQNNIPIASVYGDIVYDNGDGEEYYNTICDNGCKLKCSSYQRTGCIFCGFGAHRDTIGGGESRFVRLKKTHPKQYDYCMGGGAYDTDGFWKPNKNGLGIAHCIDEINKIYGKDFIKY